MRRLSNYAKELKSSEKSPKLFHNILLCIHLPTILDQNLEADLWLSCLLQLSIIVLVVPCINKSLLGKRLASTCSVSIGDVPNSVSVFLPISQIAKTEDLVKGLDEFAQKIDVVFAVIFI